MKVIYVCTQHDANAYRTVKEIYCYDEDGEKQIDQAATAICIDVGARDNHNVEAWIHIQEQIADRLKSAGISFDEIQFD